MFKTILIPTDGSEYAEAAADRGLELADHHGAAVSVICVADTGPFSDIRLPGDAGSADAVIRAKANEYVDRITERAEQYDELEVTSEVRSGPPESEILEYAREIDADLIVMATRGRGGVHRMALGSVTDHIIRFSEFEVYVANGAR